jgi:hypothetical protein
MMPDDHNGWHAYRFIASKVGLTSDLNRYARPREDSPHYLLTPKRRAEIVRIIEEEYGVTLTAEDKDWILNKMKSPHQLCVDFPNRFNPRHYPALTSDRPAEKTPKKTIEVYWDPDGNRGGQRGCYRVRMGENHGIHGAGKTQVEAIANFLRTAESLEESGDKNDYTVVNL